LRINFARNEEILDARSGRPKGERSRIAHDLQLRTGENTELQHATAWMKGKIIVEG